MKNKIEYNNGLHIIDNKYYIIEYNIDENIKGICEFRITANKDIAEKWINVLNNCDYCENCNKCTTSKILNEIESRCEYKLFYF